MNLRKKNAKDEYFLLICQRTQLSFHSVENMPEVVDHL